MTAPSIPPALGANPKLSMWVSFDELGEVTIRPGKVEIGQGIFTALAQLAAEGLDVDIASVRIEAASTGVSPNEGYTAGSRSIEESGAAIRQVCAEVRARFLAEASRMLEIPQREIEVRDGHFSTGGKVLTSYWELVPLVSLNVEATGEVSAPPISRGRYVGSPQPRLDSIQKVTGAFPYIQNLELPGILHGRIVRPPNLFARLHTLDVDLGPDVVLVRNGSFVGVLASREEVAIAAAARADGAARWDIERSLPRQDDLHAFLRSAPGELEVGSDYSDDPPSSFRTIKATYSRGFLAHGSIGPSCALALWENNGLRVWSSTQSVYHQRKELARAFRIPLGDVTVQFVEGAGCYGHNGADDVAYEAALLAKAVPGKPVRLQWMREDELGWAPYGPASVLDLEARLDHEGNVSAWNYEIWSNGNGGRPSHSTNGVAFVSASLLADPWEREPAQLSGVVRNAEPGYDIPLLRIHAHRVMDSPLRTSSLRSLGAHLNVFAIECFMDELADEVGVDPIEFRLRHLSDPRGRAVIERAAADASWGRQLAPDRGLGIGYARYKGVSGYCAVVAEVEATHELRVVRLSIAADVGFVINPDGVANQVVGGAIQSASWTTLEEVRFTEEKVISDNWETYPIMKFSQVPEVTISLVGAEENEPLGAGEISQGPAAAAIGNALYRAVGLRVRDMPLTAERIQRTAGL